MAKNQIFVDEIHMETQTVFHNNGNINIYPCEFELGQQIVAGDFVASQKGRMTTEADGRPHFRPRQRPSLYATLQHTAWRSEDNEGEGDFPPRFPQTDG